ncbi:MAG: tRNA (guanosine(46)-N7)-methyltransferase TrmB [Bdellovibrionales bacterium]
MDRPARPRINRTSTLPQHTEYSLALENELRHVAFSEERAPELKGRWREALEWSKSTPVDLEIGTGNGLFFAHYAAENPGRALVGLELKYKPLVQSIRRAQRAGCRNAAIVRYHAFNLDQLFESQEINNVFIHFPDPWTSPKRPKNRLTNAWFLNLLYGLQQPGSYLNFKTDSREMFDWSLEEIAKTPYKVEFQSFDLHNSDWAGKNFVTGFEKIFLQQGIKINFVRLFKAHQ